MYAALWAQGFDRMRRRLWHEAVMRSGLLTILLLSLILVGLAVGWREHRKGRFALLKAQLKERSAMHEPPPVRPGGQDVVVLQRSQLPGATGPEFLTATLLPGRGMNLLQITAYLPDKGEEVELLASPSLEEAGRLLGGADAPAAPGAALNVGGVIEAPWANRIFGAESGDDGNLITWWHGHRLGLPKDPKEQTGLDGGIAVGGLFMSQVSTDVKTNVMPDGGAAEASFHSGSFDGHWLSKTDVTTTVQLSSRAIEMKVIARNSGDEAEPIGIGWRPRFAIVSGNRKQATLRLPNGLRTEIRDRRTGMPSGRLVAVEGTEYDFTKPDGAVLGALNLDDTFVHLRQALLDNGPAAELRDPVSGYGLRITAMTSTIKAMRVYAPADANFVSIDPQFNYDDPFGREWANDEDTGMVVLQPGQSAQWKIRLEIFSLKPSDEQRF
jgi:aldose 1-epimerase